MGELLLLSNSTAPGMGFLEHAIAAIRAVLDDRASLLFVPYASSNPDGYTTAMRQALAPAGIEVTGLHQAGDLTAAVADAEAVFVGGGNSFRLLRSLTTLGLLETLRQTARRAFRTWLPAPAPIWPARPSAPPTTCRSSSQPRWRRLG